MLEGWVEVLIGTSEAVTAKPWRTMPGGRPLKLELDFWISQSTTYHRSKVLKG